MTPTVSTRAWRRVFLPIFALVLWLVLLQVFPGVFGDRDLTTLETLVLAAVLGCVFIARVVEVVPSGLDRFERRAVLWLLTAAFIVPVGFTVMWAASDVLSPVPVRDEGSLPNLVAVVGESEHNVERMLARSSKVSEQDHSLDNASPLPWARPTRVIVYALPDLDSKGSRRRSDRGVLGIWQRVLEAVGAAGSDTRLTVYFSQDGSALGARLSLTGGESARLLGVDWFKRLPSACGLDGDLSAVAPPKWAQASSDATGRVSIDQWGFGRDATDWIGYNLRLVRPPTPVLENASLSPPVSDDAGVAELTVGPGLIDTLPPPGGSTPGDGVAESDQTSEAPSPGATDAFADRTFYVIVGDTTPSESVARKRADILNQQAASSGETSPAVVVERSGHLQGLDPGDYWVLVGSTGYEGERDAMAANARMAWRVGIGTTVKSITKRCGDLTIVRIEPDSSAGQAAPAQ